MRHEHVENFIRISCECISNPQCSVLAGGVSIACVSVPAMINCATHLAPSSLERAEYVARLAPKDA